MNTVGSFIFRHYRYRITAAVQRFNSSIGQLKINRHPLAIKSSSCLIPHSKLFGSNSKTYLSRESLDDFRAREVLKEQENLELNISRSFTNNGNENDNEDIYSAKKAILNAALNFVPTYGWSKQSIAKGALSIDYPTVTNGLFPRGGVELVQFFYGQCNERFVEYLKQEAGEIDRIQNPTEFARRAIELRLRMLIPYIKQWPQALGIMTLPPNVPNALASMLTLVDDICYYAGDRSVDFNWYTRRIGLASIYKATELYMMQDNSIDYEKTWQFLKRRMEEASVVHDFLIKSEGATSHLQNAVGSAFSTARTILGLNFERR